MTTFWDALLKIAETYPNRPAIQDRSNVTTYAELITQAASLGEDLRAQGIGREDIVTLHFDKSADYLVALLGCWYAGAGFVPVPPSLPSERQDYIIKDCAPKYQLRELPPVKDCVPTPTAVTENDLAYIMYTSGSTGAPKGVMVEHSGILPVINDQIKAFRMSANDRSLFHLAITFDASLSDIGCAFLSGACLVIEDDEALRDPQKFLEVMAREDISIIDMPPSLMRVFEPADMPASLKTIVIGGEASAPETVRIWADHFHLVNVYGPTEATICSSLNTCDPEKWTQPVIGDSLSAVTYTIHDGEGNEAAEGELYISGPQLARGYLNKPDLTAEKFITKDGTRFYKTGDHVKRLENDEIAFLGRIDRQFKLRGQLIEPQEVEEKILSSSPVTRAFVLKHEEQLICFVQSNTPIDLDALRSELSKALPCYMIPDAFFVRKRLPSTASGKIDKTALLKSIPTDKAKTFTPPKTDLEKTLYDIWAEILGHKNFGTEEDFYDIGGDSLNVMRVVLAANAKGLQLGLMDIKAHKNIRGLAVMLEHNTPQRSHAMTAEDLKIAAQKIYNTYVNANEISDKANHPYKQIFITGGTGFLGGRVIAELLTKTDATLCCLVRGADVQDARTRLIDNLKAHDANISADNLTRVQIYCGDVTQDKFGLSPEDYNDLATSCDAIFHCAAIVNNISDFEALRPANLDAVARMIDFATNRTAKDLHMASTLSVAVATDQNTGTFNEADELKNTQTVYGGYAQTKWAADWMLQHLAPKHLNIWTYRFGLITGDSETGYAPEGEHLGAFINGLSSLGVQPDIDHDLRRTLAIDITPLDYAATAMTHIALNAAPATYNIAGHSATYDTIIRTLSEYTKLKPMPLEKWRNLADTQSLSEDEAAAYFALCRTFDADQFSTHRIMDLFQATDITFDCTRTLTAIEKSGISLPSDVDSLINLYTAKALNNMERAA